MITHECVGDTDDKQLRHPQCWACWIQKACDVFFAKRRKIWVKEVSDYMTPAEAARARRALRFAQP